MPNNRIHALARFTRSQKGGSIVLVGLMLALLLVVMGLVMDGGTLFVMKSKLKKAANAAVLSGAQELTNQDTAVMNVVHNILQAHQEDASLIGTDLTMGSRVAVHLQRQVPLNFAGLFGIVSAPVEVDAAAEIVTMGSAVGAAPLGIDDSIQLEYYKTYQLKVDQTQVSAGDFGVLALGGTGAATYEDNLLHGYSNRLSAGDMLDTETGNIAGKTRECIQTLIDESPYPVGDTTHRDDPRIILVPAYKPYNFTGNQLKQVQITGFAYFYITAPMSATDTAITGMFIRRAGTGFYTSGALDKGAYAIRLTE